jgi:hypothetical protein
MVVMGRRITHVMGSSRRHLLGKLMRDADRRSNAAFTAHRFPAFEIRKALYARDCNP